MLVGDGGQLEVFKHVARGLGKQQVGGFKEPEIVLLLVDFEGATVNLFTFIIFQRGLLLFKVIRVFRNQKL